MKQHLFTVGRQENMLSKLGSQSLLKGSVLFCTTRWQCVHRHIFSPDKCFGTSPPFSFSPFLTVFSRRWSSIKTQQLGIYREDFVLSSEANNYQIWWKIEHILKLSVISLCLPCPCACTCINMFFFFFTHIDVYAQLLQSEAGFTHVVKPNFVGKC